MKKLSLNKETIARLDNTDKIYGGGYVSMAGTCFDNPEHEYYTTGPNMLCLPTRYNYCPSVDAGYCNRG